MHPTGQEAGPMQQTGITFSSYRILAEYAALAGLHGLHHLLWSDPETGRASTRAGIPMAQHDNS